MQSRRRSVFSTTALLAVLSFCVFTQARDAARAAAPKISLPHNTSRISPELQRLASPGAARIPQAAAPGGLRDAGSQLLLTDSAGRVGVQVTAQDPATLAPSLKGLGMQRVAFDRSRHLVEGFLPVGSLGKLEGLSAKGLKGVVPLYRPQTGAGLVTSEADFVMEADRTRNTPPNGFDGTGVRVGVLSDSFNFRGGAAAGIASGDLPTNGVNVLEDFAMNNPIDEGRAMCELVHDLAPGANLSFATAFTGELNFANNIRRLANPADGNCDVVTDDVFYFAEPMFQDGVIAQAIDEVVTTRGVPYFSLAGNLGTQSYENTSPSFGADPDFAGDYLDFDPGPGVDTRQRITLNNQTVILTLQWDDPFYTAAGVDTDLDIYFINPSNNAIIAGGTVANLATQTPFEIISVQGTGQVDVLIQRFSGPVPGRLKWVNYGANNSGPVTAEFLTNSSTVIPHSAAVNGRSVGAVPYFNQDEPESFTSAGDNTILFAPNGTPLGAAEVRPNPDLAAVDGINTTFFGGDLEGDGRPNFFGTSAAAPHAAAVAALLLSQDPNRTPAGVYERLEDSANDLLPVGRDNRTGEGLIDAFTAVYGVYNPSLLPFSDGLETGALYIPYETNATDGGRMLVTSANGPANGSRHLTMDTSYGGAGYTEAILHVNLLGPGVKVLRFREREFNDEDQDMPASFSGSGPHDGVALSTDGVNWVRIVSLTGSTSQNFYQEFTFNLSQIAGMNGLILGADTRIKFQHQGGLPLPTEGMVFDDIRVDRNFGPTANNDLAYTVLNKSVVIPVTANDTDPEGDFLTAASVSDPPHGTASSNPDGTVTYTPDPGYLGLDSFTYRAYDGFTLSNVATVRVGISSSRAKASGKGNILLGSSYANFDFSTDAVDATGNTADYVKYTFGAQSVQSTTMFAVARVGTNSAILYGEGRLNGGAIQPFTLEVQDLGTPGANRDRFKLTFNGTVLVDRTIYNNSEIKVETR